MKSLKWILLAVLLLFATSAPIQAAHSAALSWGASATAGVSYHVKRAPCSAAIAAGVCPTASEGTFAVLATVTALTYTDATVLGNMNYSYAISAFCPTASSCAANFAVNVDSADSNHIGAAIPPDSVTPPGALTLTSVARISTGANTAITASWTDTPGTNTTYTLLANGATIGSGTVSSPTGDYMTTWSGKVKPGTQITFRVCDPSGTCSSRAL